MQLKYAIDSSNNDYYESSIASNIIHTRDYAFKCKLLKCTIYQTRQNVPKHEVDTLNMVYHGLHCKLSKLCTCAFMSLDCISTKNHFLLGPSLHFTISVCVC